MCEQITYGETAPCGVAPCMTEAQLNAHYSVNINNPAPGFLDRAERALDGLFGDDPEGFCPRCLAGTESSEHFEKCGEER